MHVVLRLRDRHPVPRDEHDLVRIRQHHCDVVRARRADLAVRVCTRRARGARRELAERPEEHVRDGPVHRLAHLDREQRSRRSHEHPAHDQDVVLELEARRGRGQAGERVEQ